MLMQPTEDIPVWVWWLMVMMVLIYLVDCDASKKIKKGKKNGQD